MVRILHVDWILIGAEIDVTVPWTSEVRPLQRNLQPIPIDCNAPSHPPVFYGQVTAPAAAAAAVLDAGGSGADATAVAMAVGYDHMRSHRWSHGDHYVTSTLFESVVTGRNDDPTHWR
jgi:hypothetical protein